MKKLVRSFGFAFKGLRYTTTTQLNFRIHLAATVLAAAMGFLLHIATNEWLWITLAIALVLITELINTSIETLTDLVSPTYNTKAGHVKDVCAGAVVIAALFALVTGLVIFLPKLILLVHHAA
ncbi:undecaprenol kinase/diacylglycerol kinase (ATP) [Mucilaginibacter pineti]|uniref:Undecaprenol kinase/diacylglycerol kinase (ATP) n=1 Tax=Mucilaginibacter pineti TaxID=1391627 RepID=A0A1G7AUJ8_9SPHI|nr:diacylglycerol kinase family protein [Mucilaginibacter pineti]SDE18451.1 undecaprenol kinase/diacylglycerol kinase (ATP) [Mucilaginibacter pineti]